MSKFYIEKPADFNVKVEVSTVFMECKKKVLLLKRVRNVLAGGLWAIPGGKLEKGETPLEAIVREIDEELQLTANPKELKFLSSYYVRHPIVEYRIHLFHWQLATIPEIVLDPREHTDFIWHSLDSIKKADLIEGQLQTFEFAYPHLFSS